MIAVALGIPQYFDVIKHPMDLHQVIYSCAAVMWRSLNRSVETLDSKETQNEILSERASVCQVSVTQQKCRLTVRVNAFAQIRKQSKQRRRACLG
jgi:hypothetical protein